MLDGDQVVAQVQAGQRGQGWTVFAARRGFFMRFMLVGLLLLALAVLAGWAIASNPDTAYIPTSIGDPNTSGTLDPTSFDRWRAFDVIVALLLGALGVSTIIRYAIDYARSQDLQLIITPSGVVVRTPKVQTYPFAAVQRVQPPQVNRNQVTLVWVMQPGSSPQKRRLVLDGRFGSSRQVAQAIIQAWQQAANRPPGATM
jgi:hypothetical protein